MRSQVSLLFPAPQYLNLGAARFAIPDEPLIHLASAPSPMDSTVERLTRALRDHGCRPRPSGTAAGVHITLRIDPHLLPQRQAYRLVIDESGITVTGTDEAGLSHGVSTFNQLTRLHPAAAGKSPTLPGLRIDDWPDFPHRAVLLDISRDKVPTMETLTGLVDMLADWKINQLQLYMEHTFAYRGHEVVWQQASPFTGQEIERLDAFCRDRFVELVPNQQSFGHMHRWLTHEPYRRLAECPEGLVHPFSPNPEPYGLCPTDPDSLVLLSDLYDQLLPHFSSRQFNVGLDETFDLGRGRSAAACTAKGVDRVYLNFLREIYRLVTARGRTMQCWCDMLRHRPLLLRDIPRDIIILEWGYEADHPFAEHLRLFADGGLTVYVCPGTSSWNSLAGRTENALANIGNAAAAGRAAGAIGLLTTDWGDNGHLQPLPVSYLGLLAGAAFGWNGAAAGNHRPGVPRLLDAHAFRDEAGVMGRLAFDLGNAYLHTGVHLHNASPLFHLLVLADRDPPPPCLERLSIEALEKTHAYIDEATAPLVNARMARPDAREILQEFRWVTEMLRVACRLGVARAQAGFDTPLHALPTAARASLADELRALITTHRRLWLRRNRPGGLDDSAGRLERVLGRLTGKPNTR